MNLVVPMVEFFLEYLQSLMLEQIKEKAEKACRKMHESNQTFEV